MIIYDCSNDGVLWVCYSFLHANLLKKGLVDAELVMWSPNHPGYNKLVSGKHLRLTNGKNDLHELDAKDINNNAFLQRKLLITIRNPLIYMLCQWAESSAGKLKTAPWDGFDNTLEHVLTNSNPETSQWHEGILE